MLNLFLAACNGGAAAYLAWVACKLWKNLDKGTRALDVFLIVLNVLCCALNLVRAFAG